MVCLQRIMCAIPYRLNCSAQSLCVLDPMFANGQRAHPVSEVPVGAVGSPIRCHRIWTWSTQKWQLMVSGRDKNINVLLLMESL